MLLNLERLFVQGEHCKHELGGSFHPNLSFLLPILPTRTHFYKVNSPAKKLKQNLVFTDHHKRWTDLKPCKNHQHTRAFYAKIYLNTFPNTELRNKKPYEFSVSGDCDTAFHFLFLLFICAYNAWVISPPCPHPLSYYPPCPFPLPPTLSIPGRNYFILINNFVDERV
jgi:hypothetical protein